MNAAEAAREVVRETRLELSITDDHIERVVLHESQKRWERFAELLDGADPKP